MGMYDEVELKQDQQCPNCKGVVPRKGFQTKDFDCRMALYKEEEDTINHEYPLPGEQKMVEVYNDCSRCRELVSFWMYVEDNTLFMDNKKPEILH